MLMLPLGQINKMGLGLLLNSKSAVEALAQQRIFSHEFRKETLLKVKTKTYNVTAMEWAR